MILFVNVTRCASGTALCARWSGQLRLSTRIDYSRKYSKCLCRALVGTPPLALLVSDAPLTSKNLRQFPGAAR